MEEERHGGNNAIEKLATSQRALKSTRKHRDPSRETGQEKRGRQEPLHLRRGGSGQREGAQEMEEMDHVWGLSPHAPGKKGCRL